MRLFHKINQEENLKNIFFLFFYPLRLGGSLLTSVSMHQPEGLSPPLFFQLERVGRGEQIMELFQSSMTYAETVSIPQPVNQFGDVWLIPH